MYRQTTRSREQIARMIAARSCLPTWDGSAPMRQLVMPNVLVTGQPLAGPVDQRVSALVEKRDDA